MAQYLNCVRASNEAAFPMQRIGVLKTECDVRFILVRVSIHAVLMVVQRVLTTELKYSG